MAKDKIPSSETKWVNCIGQGFRYVVTSNKERTLYYLYKEVDGILSKIAKNKNPTEFDKIIWKV
jgi:hypothetical protein